MQYMYESKFLNFFRVSLLMVKQCGQNRLNAEREGANLEFQVVMNHDKTFYILYC